MLVWKYFCFSWCPFGLLLLFSLLVFFFFFFFFFFLILLAENFLPCLTSRKNKIQRCHKSFCGCLTLAQQPQAGPCLVPISSTWHSPWKCSGKGFAQELFPTQRSISLSSCLPQGHLVQAMRMKFVLTPRPAPLRRESELELYSSAGSEDESQSWGNTVQRRNRSSSPPERDFSSPCSGEVALPKLMGRQQNHQQDKNNPGSFHSHLWGDNREHFCFGGHKSAKLRTLGVLV